MATVLLPGLTRVEHVIGMPIAVDVRDDDVDEGVLDDVFGWFRHVDATFSTYEPTSVISRINRHELTVDEAPDDVIEILDSCESLRDATDGYFDARAGSPDTVDPSGLVKGWSVDRAASLLDALGFANYAIFAGGDIRVRGNALPERGWRIGIQHPTVRAGIAAVVLADDGLAVATSGTYARGDHIVDPHTGRSPQGLLSVTVTGPGLATADAFATALYAMDHNASDWMARLPSLGYEAAAITAEDELLTTARFPFAGRGSQRDAVHA